MQKMTGQMSGIREPRWAMVRSRDDLTTLWREHAEGNDWPEPTVDFATQTVVAYFAGQRLSGGYRVNVSLSDDGAEALATVIAPSATDFVTHVLTAPFCLVVAPLLARDPRCVVEERTRTQ